MKSNKASIASTIDVYAEQAAAAAAAKKEKFFFSFTSAATHRVSQWVSARDEMVSLWQQKQVLLQIPRRERKKEKNL